MHRNSQQDSPPWIPMVNLAPLHQLLDEAISEAISAVMDRGDFVQGEALRQFEQDTAHFLGVKHTIGVATGTDALMLALRAAGIGAGDEVITTAFSFWATAEAIHHVGARAVFIDIAPGDMNIDPQLIEAAITPNTRAILPVHVFGQTADMASIMAIAAKHGLLVIEDAAQAFGAELNDRKAGSFGLAGCYSFYPSKPLGCIGDGGLIATNDDDLAAKLRILKDHGAAADGLHHEFAYNSRLDSMQAAVLNVKLRYLPTHLEERKRLAEKYRQLLADLPLQLPEVLSDRKHVFAQFTVRCNHRDKLQQHLTHANVASAIHYRLPMYRQPANRQQYQSSDLHLPVTEDCCQTCLSLPLFQGLSEESQDYISHTIHGFFTGKSDKGGFGEMVTSTHP